MVAKSVDTFTCEAQNGAKGEDGVLIIDRATTRVDIVGELVWRDNMDAEAFRPLPGGGGGGGGGGDDGGEYDGDDDAGDGENSNDDDDDGGGGGGDYDEDDDDDYDDSDDEDEKECVDEVC